MHFSGHVAAGREAFECLVSKDGARHFRDIQKYTAYSQIDNKVTVKYSTFWGAVSQEMTVDTDTIAFCGKGPWGMTFAGNWTRQRDGIHLDQTVWGVPGCMRGLVKTKVDRALQDVEKIVSEE